MGTDKGLMKFQGKSLVQYGIDLLKPFCAEIMISANQAQYQQFGLKTVCDVFIDCGPIGGLHAALEESHYDWNFVIGCDLPFIRPELLSLLLANKDGWDAVVPIHERGIEPLVALYRKEMASFFETKLYEKQYKLQRVIRDCKLNLVEAERLVREYPDLFRNLNSVGDLA